MYIRRLRLKNVKCFADVDLRFCDEEGDPFKWTVLLGKNGTGKTTLLQCMGLLLAGRSIVGALGGRIPNMMRAGYDQASVELDLQIGSGNKEITVSVTFEPKSRDEGRGERWSWKGERNLVKAHLVPQERGEFACGYGAARVLDYLGVQSDQIPSLTGDPMVDAMAPLYDDRRPLMQPDSWLRSLEYEALKLQNRDPAPPTTRFQIATDTLSRLLPGVSFQEIDLNRRALFRTPYGTVPFAQLSRGYRDIATWVMDLVRQLLDAFPNSTDPFAERGVVLIEEVALHLHPVWQQHLVEYLRQAFPRLQFIVSTHSPLLAQSLEKNELVILREEATEETGQAAVHVERSDIAPKALNLNQILTSPLFGAETAWSVELREKQEEFYELKRMAASEELPQENAKRYEELRQYFDAVPAAPGDSYQKSLQRRLTSEILKEMGREDLLNAPPLEVIKKMKESRSDS